MFVKPFNRFFTRGKTDPIKIEKFISSKRQHLKLLDSQNLIDENYSFPDAEPEENE